MNTHHTKLKGDIGVAAVSFNLIKTGYFVFMPTSENCPYDLICDTGEKLYRVQVKVRKDGLIPAKTTWSDKNGTHSKIIDTTSFDYFALVNEDYTKICFLPNHFAGKSIAWEYPNAYTPFYFWEDFKEIKQTKLPSKRKNNNANINRGSVRTACKIDWPSLDELLEMKKTMSTVAIAKYLGVSDQAVHKKMKKYRREESNLVPSTQL